MNDALADYIDMCCRLFLKDSAWRNRLLAESPAYDRMRRQHGRA